MFEVGQKVVCVDALSGEGTWRADIPIEGKIYTIEGFDDDKGFGLGLILFEIKNSDIWNYSFSAYRFRPVVERATDISIFKQMLTPTSKETEPAL